MYRTNTLNDILYQDKHYTKGASINVDDKDLNKLITLGAIAGEIKQPKVKINVIKNPVEEKSTIRIIDETPKAYGLDPEEENKKLEEKFEETKTGKINFGTDLQAEPKEENKRIKRKYTKRSDNESGERRF